MEPPVTGVHGPVSEHCHDDICFCILSYLDENVDIYLQFIQDENVVIILVTIEMWRTEKANVLSVVENT